jgi:hypothetical protein
LEEKGEELKDKVKKTLRQLREDVRIHESETQYSAVEVDKDDLKRLLRWAQNSSYVWFEGDRVKRTGDGKPPYGWLDMGMLGTAYADSDDDGTVYVEWDDAPEEDRRIRMFHNEIKLVK